MTQTIQPVLLVLLLVTPASAVMWTGGGGDDNWSTGLNWDTGIPPGSGEIATFDNTDAQASILPPNSIVDQDFTIGNLQFRNGSSSGNFQTVQIDSGFTLTTSNFSALTTVSSDITNVHFIGDGKFVYSNVAGTMQIGNSTSAQFVTVDMSALPEVDITANVVLIQAEGLYSNPPLVRSNSTLLLGNDNTITANILRLTGNSHTEPHLQLGTDNELYVNTIELAWGVGGGVIPDIFFQSGLTNPSVKFRNATDTGATTLLMGKPSTNNGSNVQFNLTGGVVDAEFQNVIIGQSGSAGGNRNGAGTLTFDAGTVHMTSAILADGIGTGAATGTINVNGTGELTIDDLTLGNNPNSGAATGRINISDTGTFRTSEILTGSTTEAATREIVLFGGTLGNIDGANLNVDPLVSIVLADGATKHFDVTAGHTAFYSGDITESAANQGFTKTGAGTLMLDGASTFTGTLHVQQGALAGNGSIDGHLLLDGGTLTPGASAGTFTIGSGEIASSGTLAIEIGGLTQGTQYDHLISVGDIELGGTLAITFTDGFRPEFDDVFTIIDAANVSGQFSNVNITNSTGFFQVLYLGNQVQLTNFQVPEPSTGWLLVGGLLGLNKLRRRRENQEAVSGSRQSPRKRTCGTLI